MYPARHHTYPYKFPYIITTNAYLINPQKPLLVLIQQVLLGSVLVLGLTGFANSQLVACVSCSPQPGVCISGLVAGNLSAPATNTSAAGQTLLGATAVTGGLLQAANYTMQLAGGNLTTITVPLNGSNATAISTLFKPSTSAPTCKTALVRLYSLPMAWHGICMQDVETATATSDRLSLTFSFPCRLCGCQPS